MWVNAKSILGVMTLAAECGSEVTVRAEGTDAREAIAALIGLLSRDFADEYLLEEEVGE
jgi:phosphotransferase system HPr (HPr) family protein